MVNCIWLSMDKLTIISNKLTHSSITSISHMNSKNLYLFRIMKGSKKLLTDFEVISTSLLQLGENFEVFTNHIN